ncbi:MAG: hypothetical protein ACK559_27325, partial [bacterium]
GEGALVGGGEADVAVVGEVHAGAGEGRGGPGVGHRVGGEAGGAALVHAGGRRRVQRGEGPEAQPPRLPGELEAADGRDDAARVEGVGGVLEGVPAVQEERALLAVVEGEALVEVDLQHVPLDLREV